MIEIEKLSVDYKNGCKTQKALENFNLTIETGDICALIGPSGCGKSTLLHVMANLMAHSQGEVRIDGKTIDPNHHSIGFIQQHYGLLNWATVYNNIILGLRIKKENINQEHDNIEMIIAALGLDKLRHKYPQQLSGGEQQRVCIAQAFLLKPDILLMDEPFSALDAISREKTQDLFLEIWQKHRVSAIFVTHSIEEALMVGNKIAIMTPSPGQISEIWENTNFGKKDLRLKKEYYRDTIALRERVGLLWQ
ncbi:MAG: ABC transporter ATP-binding protein [Clostridiales bacterium]